MIVRKKKLFTSRRRRSSKRMILPLLLLVALLATVSMWQGAPKDDKTADKNAGKNSGAVRQVSSKNTKKAAPAAKKKKESRPFSIIAVGDCMFDRKVSSLLEVEGPIAVSSAVKKEFDGASLAIANLEGPLTSNAKRLPGKDVTLLGNPLGLDVLKAWGVDFVSLANNHSLDGQKKGLTDTLDVLDEADIRHAGAGLNSDSAFKPAIVERDGKKIAFLAYSDIVPTGFWPDADTPGIAHIRPGDEAELKSAVKDAKISADLVVISFHWGTEYANEPTTFQRSISKAAIDAGADLVIGHHPHVIQGLEIYHGRPIIYSLGNFVFDHFSTKTGQSLILKETFADDGNKIELIPVYLTDKGAPEPASEAMGSEILARLKALSKERGCDLTVENGRAVITAVPDTSIEQ